MRLRDSSHTLEPGDMCTSVFVYTTARVTRVVVTECDFKEVQQPRARTHGFTGVAAHVVHSLIKKGNEIQRCWRLYELCRARNGPGLLVSDLIRRVYIVYLVLLIAYASSIRNSITNG
jgi:hypothetical protein